MNLTQEATSSAQTTPIWYWLLAIVGGLMMAIHFGFAYPVSNQNTYLIHATVRANEALLTFDWYAREAADIHSMFSRVAALIFRMTTSRWPFVIIETMLTTIGVVAIASLCRSMARTMAAATMALMAVLVWGFVTDTTDVMGSFLFAGYLQPSGFGQCGLLCAMALFARRQYQWSGLALAVGGSLHLNFLVLSLASFGLAHIALLVIRKERLSWMQVKAFVAPMIVFVWALPQFLAASSGPAAEAVRISATIRAPHHFQPTLAKLLPLFAWQGAAWLVIIAVVVSHRRWAMPRAAVALLVGVGGFVTVASLLAIGLHVQLVVQLFVWRFAPGATVLAQVIIVVGLSQARMFRWFGWPLVLAAVVMMVMVAIDQPLPQRPTLWTLAALMVVTGVLARTSWTRVPTVIAAVFGTAVLLHTAWPTVKNTKLHIREGGRDTRGLYAFAQGTAVDALFVVPPGFAEFRIQAQRSIVADWKSAGAMPADIVEWYRRISLQAGRSVRSRNDAKLGYGTMDGDRASSLRAEFGARYLVIAPTVRLPFVIAYSDHSYCVYDLTQGAP